MPFWGT